MLNLVSFKKKEKTLHCIQINTDVAIIIFQNKNKNRKPTPHNVQADITEISEKKSLPFLSPFGVGMSYVMTSFCFFSTSSFFCQKQRAKLIVKNLKSLTHVQLLWIWFWKRSWSVTMGVPFHILETYLSSFCTYYTALCTAQTTVQSPYLGLLFDTFDLKANPHGWLLLLDSESKCNPQNKIFLHSGLVKGWQLWTWSDTDTLLVDLDEAGVKIAHEKSGRRRRYLLEK